MEGAKQEHSWIDCDACCCRWRCAGRLSIAYPAASKAQIAAPQQAQDPTVQAALQQTAGLAEVAQPEQVKRKGKKRTRVAAAA